MRFIARLIRVHGYLWLLLPSSVLAGGVAELFDVPLEQLANIEVTTAAKVPEPLGMN